MLIAELIFLLQQYPPDTVVYAHDPVQGDSENVRQFLSDDLFLDERISGLVIY